MKTATVPMFLFVALSLACGVDQKKFDGVYRTGKTIQAAVDSGVNMIRYSELTQAFSAELSIATDHASSSKEKRLIGMYSEAGKAYHAALVIWQPKLEGQSDTLFGGPTLDALLTPHGVKFVDGGGGAKFASADEAMRTVWKKASDQLNAANDVLNRH